MSEGLSPDDWTIVLPRTVLRRVLDEVVKGGNSLETGGILLGRDNEPARITRLTWAGGPGPFAIREPRFFLRDLDHAQVLATQAWENERSQWVGEWHTHPQGQPIPSDLDLHSYRAHLQDPELGFRRFISLIVAWDSRAAWSIGGWYIDDAGTRRGAIEIAD